MQLHAYTRTISDLFSVKKQYVVPRFQREYSWTKEQVRELWSDIATAITWSSNDGFEHEEYFIGALVLVGDDKSSKLQIVDGQQRLTTLTILLAVLCERFRQLGVTNVAQAIYDNYIAGKDDNGGEYFKLQNESPKPFFQRRIQHIAKEPLTPASQEESTLLAAYENLLDLTSRESIQAATGMALTDDTRYELYLSEVRDHVVHYLKVIFITVNEEDEAYTIFETLNARGMNLSSVDLIKNRLFRELTTTHPDDRAKTAWQSIRQAIRAREGVGTLDGFVRHWWISKYSYVSEDNIYKQFRRLLQRGKIDAREFIQELADDAKLYAKISSPVPADFPEQERRSVLDSLVALKTFGITQQRPFVLSLMKAHARGVVKQAKLKAMLRFLECFHFMFNAVCSLRPSGVEGTYSRASRDLANAYDTSAASKVLDGLRIQLSQRIPDEATFVERFAKIRYHDKFTKQRRLVQYILFEIERKKIGSAELRPDSLSIEHILSQVEGPRDVVGRLGNLLPLGADLNVKAGSKKVADKIPMYEKSMFKMTREFAAEFDGTWDAQLIVARTETLARHCYNEVWKI